MMAAAAIPGTRAAVAALPRVLPRHSPMLLRPLSTTPVRWSNSAASADIQELVNTVRAFEEQLEASKASAKTAAEDNSKLRSEIAGLSQEIQRLVNMIDSEQVGSRARKAREGAEGELRGAQGRQAYRPDLEYAVKQPTHVSEMGHQTLAELAILGNHSAHRERLLREIMAVEGCSWVEAHDTLTQFDDVNERFYWVESLPYRIGITAAFVGGIGATLMVFSKPVALWYAENIAGESLPEEVKDISEMTTNQVGTWTWSWMEPMIGTASFILLCCQFTRAQAAKMNMKPYSEIVLQWRADRLARAFPQYDRSITRAWAKHMPSVGMNFFPQYEKNAGLRGPSSGL